MPSFLKSPTCRLATSSAIFCIDESRWFQAASFQISYARVRVGAEKRLGFLVRGMGSFVPSTTSRP
jgi:hypothetical protein